MINLSTMASDNLYERITEDEDLYQSLKGVDLNIAAESTATQAIESFANNLSWMLGWSNSLENISCSVLHTLGHDDIDSNKSSHQSIGVTGGAIILAGINPWWFHKDFREAAVADRYRNIFVNNSEKIVTMVSDIKTVNRNTFSEKGVFGKNFKYPENETQIMEKKNGLLEISKVCGIAASLPSMNLIRVPMIRHIEKTLPNTSFRDLVKWEAVKTIDGEIFKATIDIEGIENATVDLALEYAKNKVDASSGNKHICNQYRNDTFHILDINRDVTTFSSKSDFPVDSDTRKSQVTNGIKAYFHTLKTALYHEAKSSENKNDDQISHVTCNRSIESLSYTMSEARFIAMWVAAPEGNLQTGFSICGSILYSMSSSINRTNGIAEQMSRFISIATSMKGNDKKGFLHAVYPVHFHYAHLEERTKTCLNNTDYTLLLVPPLADKLQSTSSQKTQNIPFSSSAPI